MIIDPISSVFDVVSKVIDRAFPDKQQADKAKLELLKMQQEGDLARLSADTDLAKAQLEVNKAEASNPSLFVSGWRPFIGWNCGFALVYQFIVWPMLTWVSLVEKVPPPPTLHTDTLLSLLGTILGLGAYRSMEIIKDKRAPRQ